MNPENPLLSLAHHQLYERLLGGCCLLIAIWLLYRQRRYSRELAARQQQRELLLVNETWKTAFGTVLREQPRRLRDLVDDTENESSHTP
jgi:hypothetical protein